MKRSILFIIASASAILCLEGRHVQADEAAGISPPKIHLDVRIVRFDDSRSPLLIPESGVMPSAWADKESRGLIDSGSAKRVSQSSFTMHQGIPVSWEASSTKTTYNFNALCLLRQDNRVAMNFFPEATATVGYKMTPSGKMPVLLRERVAKSAIVPVGSTLCFRGVDHPHSGTLFYYVTPTVTK